MRCRWVFPGRLSSAGTSRVFVYVVANRLRLIRESVCSAISEFRVELRFTDILHFHSWIIRWCGMSCMQIFFFRSLTVVNSAQDVKIDKSSSIDCDTFRFFAVSFLSFIRQLTFIFNWAQDVSMCAIEKTIPRCSWTLEALTICMSCAAVTQLNINVA